MIYTINFPNAIFLAGAVGHLVSKERSRPKEFHLLQATDVAFALALPTAKRELSIWQPFKAPEVGLKAIAKWQDLGDKARFSALLDASLIPHLRKALVAWAPREFEPCIRLMETCKKVLRVEVADALVAEVVLPRLRSEIETWDPRVDQRSAHLWLHPWLPLLGKKMEMLWTPIRFKISSCLEKWDSSDPSAHGLLEPWQQARWHGRKGGTHEQFVASTSGWEGLDSR